MSGEEKQECCARCGRFTRDPADRMTALGFGQCAHQPKYIYLPVQRASCAFDPSHFEAAA